MKKILCALLAAAALLLCACGGTANVEQTPEITPANHTPVPVPKATPIPTPEPTSVMPKPDRNGFDVNSNARFTFCGLSFQIPAYYSEPEKGSSTYKIKVEESGKAVGIISFLEGETNGSVSDDEFRNKENEIVTSFAEELNAEIGKIEEISICDCAAVKADLTVSELSGYIIAYNFPGNKSIAIMVAAYSNYSEYDYIPDLERILESAELAPAETETDGVSPEFKAQMDKYEEFFDEYVDFMQSYMDSGDVVGMLGKYANMMTKYSEMMDALDEIDETQLSAADYAYYIEVTARITQKLLGVMG